VSIDPHTRRQVLVDRRFQLKYVAGLALAGACVCASFGVAVWMAVRQARESLPPEARAVLAGTETTILVLTVFMAVVMAAALSLVALLVTHRVAGPMRVLRGQMRVLADGRYPRWRPLRSHDELRELFAEFHAAVDALRRREHEELATLEDALAAGQGAGTAALEHLTSRKRASLDRSAEG
jgi:nitrogen fixation/metabolism regulation signal transduction histidine kinase